MIQQLTAHNFDQWKLLRLEAVTLHPASFGESLENVQQQDKAWFEDSLKKGTIFAYEQHGEMVGLIEHVINYVIALIKFEQTKHV